MKTYKWNAPKKINVPEVLKAGDMFEGKKLKENKTTEKEIDNPFKGSVIIQVPKYTERLGYIKECNFNPDDGASSSTYESMIKMVGIAKKHITKVELLRISDEQIFSSVDDLEYDKEGSDVLNTIATLVLEGVKLGKF